MTGLTESLARFAADPGFRAVPEEAARIVTTGFIDTVATLLAGRNEPVVGILAQFIAAKKSRKRFCFGPTRWPRRCRVFCGCFYFIRLTGCWVTWLSDSASSGIPCCAEVTPCF